MMYRVETTPRFDRDFKKLDRYTQKNAERLDCQKSARYGKSEAAREGACGKSGGRVAVSNWGVSSSLSYR